MHFARLLPAIVMVTLIGVAFAAEPKEGDKGTFTGKVTEKGETWFRAVSETGESLRFRPHWHGGMPADGGGLDKTMLDKIQSLAVGDKVEVTWEFTEHLRAAEVRVLEKAARD